MHDVLNQTKLSPEQIQAFYHDEFVEDQVRDFRELVGERELGVVVDIGGGCGFFAKNLQDHARVRARVLDTDPQSIETCNNLGVEGRLGDALAPSVEGDEEIACFNLILHHLVGKNEAETRRLQARALRAWHGEAKQVFVNEYIYQSWFGQVSGRIIYEITSSRLLSAIGKQVARIIPSFRANTFGVGVRFRSHEQWRQVFAEAGYRVVDTHIGVPERVSPPLRTLMIKTIRRDSFLLEAA